MNIDTFDEENPEFLEALAHEKRAESEMLLARSKRLRAVQRTTTQTLPEALTTDELCAALKISKPTVGRLIKDGMPVSHAGARRRFDLAEVKRWQAERGRKAAPKSEAKPRVEVVAREVEFSDRDLQRMGLRKVAS